MNSGDTILIYWWGAEGLDKSIVSPDFLPDFLRQAAALSPTLEAILTGVPIAQSLMAAYQVTALADAAANDNEYARGVREVG